MKTMGRNESHVADAMVTLTARSAHGDEVRSAVSPNRSARWVVRGVVALQPIG